MSVKTGFKFYIGVLLGQVAVGLAAGALVITIMYLAGS